MNLYASNSLRLEPPFTNTENQDQQDSINMVNFNPVANAYDSHEVFSSSLE